MNNSHILILGGGIIGLATAYNLCRQYPDVKITIIEKEPVLAAHQTGRNSGVLHTGIYYKPGSLKALNCRKGKGLMEAFCEAEGIPFDLVGKVIVAASEAEIPAMNELFRRGQANGVHCKLISREELLEVEPHVNGIAAIHVPEAGITDYKLVVNRFADIVQEHGGEIVLNAQVTDIVEGDGGVTAVTTQGDFTGDYLVNCTGLHSDRLTRMTAGTAPAKIVPFRGEYFELKLVAHHLCNGLIYPVPNPKFPFLGVHFTRMIHGGVDCGPNAVLAFAREGYNKTDFNAARFVGNVDLQWVSQVGWAILDNWYWRDVAVSKQGGVCEGIAKTNPCHSCRTFGPGPSRHSRPGAAPRWLDAG